MIIWAALSLKFLMLRWFTFLLHLANKKDKEFAIAKSAEINNWFRRLKNLLTVGVLK